MQNYQPEGNMFHPCYKSARLPWKCHWKVTSCLSTSSRSHGESCQTANFHQCKHQERPEQNESAKWGNGYLTHEHGISPAPDDDFFTWFFTWFKRKLGIPGIQAGRATAVILGWFRLSEILWPWIFHGSTPPAAPDLPGRSSWAPRNQWSPGMDQISRRLQEGIADRPHGFTNIGASKSKSKHSNPIPVHRDSTSYWMVEMVWFPEISTKVSIF